MLPVETSPPLLLYRIGRAAGPLLWPEPAYSGSNRFDAPAKEFRTLYAADDPVTCFIETLAPLRPNLAHLARAAALPPGEHGDDLFQGGVVTVGWCAQRALASFRLDASTRALDFRALATREALRHELAPILLSLGLEDFDASDALSRRRELTQQVALWAFREGYRALAYRSRFDPDLSCWAVFEGARLDQAETTGILPTDLHFLTALHALGLSLQAAGS